MKNYICCFTGHRDIPLTERKKIQKRLETALLRLIDQGVCYFGAGGALGFDTLAALTVLRLQERHPNIQLILVLPCRDQTRSWLKEDKKIYNQIYSKANKFVYTSEYYYNGCMQKRNRHLIDNSAICICYLTKSTGGTAYTVDYAKKRGLIIINLAEENSLPRL